MLDVGVRESYALVVRVPLPETLADSVAVMEAVDEVDAVAEFDEEYVDV